ncbi:MAG: hypothetical protein IKE40_00300 [Firmicutes bacterium]|nr:hypothetical protein [Bacillota bacterium]
MRKLIVYLITAAMLVSMLAVPAFAADPATESGIYDLQYENNITVVPQKANGTAVQGKTVSIDGADKTLYPEAEKLALTYSRVTANAYYLAVVIEADANGSMPSPTEDNLTYIDQQTATTGTGGGTVSFTLFPKEMKAGKTYLICISGNGQALAPVGNFKYFEYVPYVLGDVDEDTLISPKDALWVLQAAAHNRDLTEKQTKAADVDKDELVSPKDALWILQAAAHNRVL